MSNTTFISADRATHLKVVGVAVAASITAGFVGFNARGMQVASSARVQPAIAPIAVGTGVVQSNRNFPPNPVRG